MATAHPNRCNLCRVIPGLLNNANVVIRFIAPKRELIPDRCNANIAKSTLTPEWLAFPLNGGYSVQPVPAPPSIRLEKINNNKLGGNNQKDMLFNLGKAVSTVPIISGIR